MRGAGFKGPGRCGAPLGYLPGGWAGRRRSRRLRRIGGANRGVLLFPEEHCGGCASRCRKSSAASLSWRNRQVRRGQDGAAVRGAGFKGPGRRGESLGTYKGSGDGARVGGVRRKRGAKRGILHREEHYGRCSSRWRKPPPRAMFSAVDKSAASQIVIRCAGLDPKVQVDAAASGRSVRSVDGQSMG